MMYVPLIFLLLLVAATASAQVAASPEMVADRARRDAGIHWPKEFAPGIAPVFAHNELLIHAGCHEAFATLTDATGWPNWFPLVTDVVSETPGRVGEGTLFRLKIFASPIHSRVVEFVPDERVSWVPFGADETESKHGHFHAWHFLPATAGCRVITEETGIGPNDVRDPVAASHLMHKAHELWLDGLRWKTEP